MAASTYGTYPAAAIEPFPIETSLAGLAAGGSPGRAQQLLSLYQTERNTAENQYYDLMQQQRGLAYANLHQQMVDRAVKTMADAAQHPEMAPYLQGFQYGREAMGPGDPNAANQLFTNLNTAASLNRGKTAAEIIQQSAAGGGMVDLDQLNQRTGLGFAPSVATSVAAGLARASGQQPRSAFSIPISLDPAQYGRNPATLMAWSTNVGVTGDAARDQAAQDLARQQLIAQANAFKNRGATFKPSGGGGTATNLTPANPQGDMNPTTNPLLGPLPGYGPNGLPLAQIDTPATPAPQTPASTGGGAQAATPASVRDKIRNAPDVPATPPNVRPANMPDTNPGDTEAWKSPAGQANQKRARAAMANLPPQVHDAIVTQYAKTGQIPLAVKDNVLHFVGPDGSDLGVVP